MLTEGGLSFKAVISRIEEYYPECTGAIKNAKLPLISIFNVHAAYPFVYRAVPLSSESLLRAIARMTNRGQDLLDEKYMLGVVRADGSRRSRTVEDRARLIFLALARCSKPGYTITDNQFWTEAQVQDIITVLSIVQTRYKAWGGEKVAQMSYAELMPTAERLFADMRHVAIPAEIDGQVFACWKELITALKGDKMSESDGTHAAVSWEEFCRFAKEVSIDW